MFNLILIIIDPHFHALPIPQNSPNFKCRSELPQNFVSYKKVYSIARALEDCLSHFDALNNLNFLVMKKNHKFSCFKAHLQAET